MKNLKLLLVTAGVLLRLLQIYITRAEPPHTDFGSFLEIALNLAHPFDTSPREPYFIWWLWILSKMQLTSTVQIRIATSLWYVPCLYLIFSMVRERLGDRGAWIVAVLYTILPAQIQADAMGMRHTLEGFGVLLLLKTIENGKAFMTSFSFAALVMTRLTYLFSGTLIMALAAFRFKTFKPLLAILPVFILLHFHFQNNESKHGDYFYSINIPTYFNANLEYIGQPGFPKTMEEWQKDVFKKSLTFREWAFQRHSIGEFLKETVVGYFRCLWIFYERVYFSVGLPSVVKWPFLFCFAAGFFLSLFRPCLRDLALTLSFLVLPWAFGSHVFWAGRYFIPNSPFVLAFVAAAALGLYQRFEFVRRKK